MPKSADMTDSQKLDHLIELFAEQYAKTSDLEESGQRMEKRFDRLEANDRKQDKQLIWIMQNMVTHEEFDELKDRVEYLAKGQSQLYEAVGQIAVKMDRLLVEDTARTAAKRRQDESIENLQTRVKKLEKQSTK